MPRIIHPLAGLIAILTIATFWLSTAISELFASQTVVTAVKTAIPWGFIVLIPALAATGGSGFFLSKGQRKGAVGTKLKRMPFIAANGILVLIPAALFLAYKARAGEFDAVFYTVQAVELIAGAINITLLALSMRDGMALTQWRRKSFLRPAATSPARLLGRKEVAKGTLALRLSRPEGFQFVAGQAVYVSLPDLEKADAGGRIRTFSIASDPGDSELEIAIRRTDTSFKRYLDSAGVGTLVQVEGPYGDLALHDDANRPAVFLAGGIGITPFRSMVVDATSRALPHRMFLFYSNRTPEDAAFIAELRELEAENPKFKLIATFTDSKDVPRNGSVEHGYINAEMLARHLGDLSAPIFYVAGPPAMVAAMEEMLASAGVSQKNVRAEKFAGYWRACARITGKSPRHRPLAELSLQRAPVHAEQTRGGGNIAVGFGQGLLDVLPLDPRQRRHHGGLRGFFRALTRHGTKDRVHRGRLGQIVVRAALDRLHGGRDTGVAGDQHDAHGGARRAQRRDQVERAAVALGELEVEQGKVRAMLARELQGFVRARRSERLDATTLQRTRQGTQVDRVVVEQQAACHPPIPSRGTRNRTRVPPPAAASITSSPPSRSIAARDSASPTPMPSGLPLRNSASRAP